MVVLQDGRSERLTVCAGSNPPTVQDALTEYHVIESCPQGPAGVENLDMLAVGVGSWWT
uniref:Uncharacterized protein n=1 Tax=Setaria italica TaxID=4555 RepID=K3YBJ6_SETIT